jgi:hypothetical protein
MKKFKVIYKRLIKNWGQANMATKEIEIDVRAKGKKHLELLIHESLHLLYPDEPEEAIEKNSILMTNTIWSQKYRRVDDTNHIPLQDGTK